jgi:fibronectin type 3 domain-containing protein
LSWNAPASSSDPVKGFNIYRSTGSGSFQRINSSVDDQTTYQDGSVQSGVTYKYYVTTVDGSGVESGPSNSTTVSVP